MKNTVPKQAVSVENVFQLEGRVPLAKAIPFGLQHILAMFVANLSPITIIAAASGLDGATLAILLQNAMIAAGLATFIQLYPIWKIGAKLPIVMGCSFTFLAAMLGIVTSGPFGYEKLVGAIIVGGCIEGTLGLTAKYWVKYLGDIVPACVVMAIGLSLLNVGMNSFGGGQGAADFGAWYHLVIGLITLVSCLVFKAVAKGVWRNLDVLFGLIVGYVVSIIFTVTGVAPVINFDAFKETIGQLGFFKLPMPVFLKGFTPQFDIGAIASMTIVFLVSAAETIGGTAAVAQEGLGREVTIEETCGSLGVDGYGSAFSGLFGACPITSFNQNIGLIAMTKVVNRFTILMGALLLILAACFPPIGAFFNTIPQAVLGGCTVMMYGSIVFSGVKMIQACGDTERNMTIVALAFCVGVGVTQVDVSFFSALPSIFADIFAGNSVAGVFVLALLLDLFLPGKNKK